MGHKEDLLEGAKKCLLELGYTRTTARDIVAASHTNLASIGYHFGSKDALMTTAMIEMIGEWGGVFDAVAASGGARDSAAKFHAVWARLLETFRTDHALLIASYEIAAVAARSPELRAIFARTYVETRPALADSFLELGPVDARTKRAVGGLILALISGMTVQHLLDPDGAPTADDLSLAMAAIAPSFVGKA